MAQTVKFDPGMGEFVLDFSSFINNVYSEIMTLKTIHQKKARFKLYVPKIQKYIKNNISFYLGCLLWAYIISTENKNSPKDIVGNVFLYMSPEQKEEYDYMIQINFLENYFSSFEKDIAYYVGEKYQIPIEWKEILSLYSEFLELNKGFISVKSTEDIILPEKLLMYNFSQDINSVIEKAIYEKDLELILNTVKIS